MWLESATALSIGPCRHTCLPRCLHSCLRKMSLHILPHSLAHRQHFHPCMARGNAELQRHRPVIIHMSPHMSPHMSTHMPCTCWCTGSTSIHTKLERGPTLECHFTRRSYTSMLYTYACLYSKYAHDNTHVLQWCTMLHNSRPPSAWPQRPCHRPLGPD